MKIYYYLKINNISDSVYGIKVFCYFFIQQNNEIINEHRPRLLHPEII